jgi:hypothetical protein
MTQILSTLFLKSLALWKKYHHSKLVSFLTKKWIKSFSTLWMVSPEYGWFSPIKIWRNPFKGW